MKRRGTALLAPVATFRSPFATPFGLPRQSGLAPTLRGRVVFEPAWRSPDAVRGLEGFDRIWLLWGFHQSVAAPHATVRPPRLGGNERLGVFATRSPCRPNGLGLSCVRLLRVGAGELEVAGADLADGSPIFDVKPYLPYADAHPDARAGFAAAAPAPSLRVRIPAAVAAAFSPADRAALRAALALDPRPAFRRSEERVYGFSFAGREIRFRVRGGTLAVLPDQSARYSK